MSDPGIIEIAQLYLSLYYYAEETRGIVTRYTGLRWPSTCVLRHDGEYTGALPQRSGDSLSGFVCEHTSFRFDLGLASPLVL